ncbi:MAG: tetratricopeptide repeat protein [Oscillatoriales cyanobacterium SM2_3_0]|nr:tetratricopeptide repeat protein [Oscillatoriales cyanobacterium SM2_3_0]
MQFSQGVAKLPEFGMDYQQFAQQLPNLNENWENSSTQPETSQLQLVLEQIGCGAILTNLLQLLNRGTAYLEPGEVYCEIGTSSQGATLIGALLNQPERSAYAVGRIANPRQSDQHLEELISNLQKFGLEEQVIFCGYDPEEFLLEFRQFETQSKIGVFFYNGETDYRSVLISLLLVQASLADQAVIIVNDADHSIVRQAVWDFMAVHSQCQILLEFPVLVPSDSEPEILILSWDIHRDANYSPATLLEQRQPDVISSLKHPEMVPTGQQQFSDLYQQAIDHHEQGNLYLAQQHYQDLLSHQPDHGEAWLNLGILQYDLGSYEDSFKALVQSVELEPLNGNVHYYLGLCLEKRNQPTQAVIAYQKAIELEPDLIDAYNNLGNIWYQQGEYREAEVYYRARSPPMLIFGAAI